MKTKKRPKGYNSQEARYERAELKFIEEQRKLSKKDKKV